MLLEVARVFLVLGLTAFGGPAVHVAMMEEELVRKRRWVTPERFLDLFGASNLIPGPGSTELGIFLGFERAGHAGLIVAGVCFILPAALVTGGLAWAYLHWGARPELAGMLRGVKPVVIAVVGQAIAKLLPKAVRRSWALGLVGVAAAAGAWLGLSPLAVLLASGMTTIAWHAVTRRGPDARAAWVMELTGAGRALGVESSADLSAAPSAMGVLLSFLKIGAVSFGGGYVLVAFLRSDLVLTRHWLTESQLLDAATVGLARAALVDGPTLAIGVVAAVLHLRFKVASTWLVLGGAGVSFVLGMA